MDYLSTHNTEISAHILYYRADIDVHDHVAVGCAVLCDVFVLKTSGECLHVSLSFQ